MGISIFRDFVVVGGWKNPVKSSLLYHGYIGLPAVGAVGTWSKYGQAHPHHLQTKEDGIKRSIQRPFEPASFQLTISKVSTSLVPMKYLKTSGYIKLRTHTNLCR
jgi:hypothetical protein